MAREIAYLVMGCYFAAVAVLGALLVAHALS